MRIVCPHCSARLQLPAAPEPDTAVRCPKCREEFFPTAEDAEEAAPAPTRSAYRRPDAAGKKFPVVLVGVAGALLVAGGIAIAVLVGGGGKPAADKGKANPAPEPPKKDARGAPKSGPGPAAEKLPPELAALFRAPAADPPTPTAFIPTLERDARAADLGVTAVAVPRKGGAQPKEAAADDRTPEQVVEDVKRATVFVKIDTGTATGSGSGFVVRADGDTALVATNNHVVRDKDGSDRGKISVVFDSGLRANEQELPAQLVAADAAADLALLRVAGVKKMPRPIDPRLAPKPTETMPVKISGFPFGEQLAAQGRNPDITIGPGSVSSIRHDAAGRIDKVQITGSINPGNSGGPVVDERGRLVGVTVSTIKGAGFGFAVPAPSLAAMLDGRLLQPVFEGAGVEDGRAVFRVVVPVQDPLRRVKGVTLHVLADGSEKAAEADAATVWKPLAGAEAIELTVDPGRAATGSLRLPAGQNQSVAVVQVACTATDGAVAVSPPVPFKLTRDGARAAGDSISLAALDRSPEKYDGQVVAVGGKMVPAALPKLGVFELDVVNENDAKPVNLLFLTAAEVAGQLRELPDASRAVPARLTCRVGKKGADGITPVRVTRIELVDRAGRVRLTVPSDELEKDPLIALNRAPDKFLGQTLTLPALVSPTPLVKGMEAELVVLYALSEKAPDNLAFVTTRDIAVQLNAEGSKEDAVPAWLTARVETKKLAGKRVVTVTRIVLFGPDGKPRKTIE